MTRRSVASSASLLVVVAAVLAAAGSASNGIGRLQQATLSTASGSGGADLSNGSTPADGSVGGTFTYQGEGGGGTQTTVVDWSLPAGVTVHFDAGQCSGKGVGGYCLDYETDCDPSTADPQAVTVSGNEIEFRLACQSGEGFDFEADLDSLIAANGLYDMSVQFKINTLRRTSNNMWQIKLPESFCVGSACT
jgi:hypothetical protein